MPERGYSCQINLFGFLSPIFKHNISFHGNAVGVASMLIDP